MQLTRQSRRILRNAAALIVAVGITTAVQANWFAEVTSGTEYTVRFTKVPDMDQQRSVLPNNGTMYCVPTSAFNWLAYIGRHGYPSILPGDHSQQYWHAQSQYNLVSNYLAILGILMNTSPTGGTGGASAQTTLQSWLGNEFIVFRRYLDTSNTPRFDNIGAWMLAGAPVLGRVGWYSDNGATLTRNGGHLVSVVRAQRSGSSRSWTIHDPADDGNLTTQSSVNQVPYGMDPRVRIVQGQGIFPRVIDKVVGYGSGYIDGYIAIFPLFGLSASPDWQDLVLIKPQKFTFNQGPTHDTLPAPGGAQIADVMICPQSPSSFVLTEAIVGGPPSKAWRFDPAERTFEELASFDDAQKGVFDRFGRMYVLDGRTIRCMAFDEEGRLVEEASKVLPSPCDAIAVDDVHDLLLALCDGSVHPFGVGGLNALPAVQVPAGVVIGGETSMAVSPMDGAIFLTSELSSAVFRLHPPDPIRANGFDEIGVGLLTRPRDLSLGDGDCVYVMDADGVVKVFCPDEQTGEWTPDPNSPFAGVPAGRGLKIAYSRDNYDPQLHDGPEFNNVLPTEFGEGQPDCFADINDDNKVDGADLGLLLGGWGSDNPDTDLNGDGVTNGADLGLMLGAWGACPF